MRKITLCFICICFSFVLMAQEITGLWAGKISIQNAKLSIVFHIEKTDSGYDTKMDSPDQGAYGLSTSKTVVQNNQLEISADNLGLSYSGFMMGDSIMGILRQSGMEMPLILHPAEKRELVRPQEPMGPFPYKSNDVTFRNEKDGIMLSGIIALPDTVGQFPAVVLIAGSGPNDRDETIMGHKPFLVIADHLSRNGFAVLRYDKRGVGKSEGHYATATTIDFAEDAAAAFHFLKMHRNIDPKRIALMGHSEGGVIAPMIAVDDKSVAAIGLMAGMGVDGSKLLLQQNATIMQMQQLPQETIDETLAVLEEIHGKIKKWDGSEEARSELTVMMGQLWNVLPPSIQNAQSKEQHVSSNLAAMVSPWYRYFLAIDPADYLSKVKCPVFAANGEKDIQVDATQNLDAIRSSLKKGRNKKVTIQSYPGLNHLFQECETGAVAEYAKIEQTFSPQVLSDITRWLKTVL